MQYIELDGHKLTPATAAAVLDERKQALMRRQARLRTATPEYQAAAAISAAARGMAQRLETAELLARAGMNSKRRAFWRRFCLGGGRRLLGEIRADLLIIRRIGGEWERRDCEDTARRAGRDLRKIRAVG